MIHSRCLLTSAPRLSKALRGPNSTCSPLQYGRPGVIHRTITNQRRVATPAITRESDRLAEFTRDEKIDTAVVQLKTEGGKIEEPQSLRSILQSINRETHCVVQLSKPGERDAAVVEVKAKMDLIKQLRERENQVRQVALAQREKKPKQIELNWAISENDLNLKVKQLETFLEKGKTVEILLAAKKRQRKATVEEGTSVLKRIQQAIQELDAKEVKPMQGQILKQATLIVKR